MKKLFIFILIILVVGSGLVVVYDPVLINDVTNILNNNNNNNNSTNSTSNPQAIFKNATLTPPFPTAKYNFAGGNQLANLHFEMDVQYAQDSYQYTNMHFVGTVTNMSAFTLKAQVNKKFTFNLNTNVTSCTFGQSQNTMVNNQPTYTPTYSSSVTAGDINMNGQDEYIAAYSTACQSTFDSKVTILEWNATTQTFKTWDDFHIGLYEPQVLALDLKGNGHSELLLAGYTSTTATALTLRILDFAPHNQRVSNANNLVMVNKTLTNTNLLPNQQVIMDKGNIGNTLEQSFFIYGQAPNRQYTANVYRYSYTNQSLTKITSFTDADLGRPIFASLLQNGNDQLIIPKREEIIPPNDQTSSPPVYSANTQTNESGFIYQITPTNTTKLAYFPYRGIVGAGNIAGSGRTDIIELDYCAATCSNNVHIFTLDSSYVLQDAKGNYLPLKPVATYTSSLDYSFNPPCGSMCGESSFSTFRSNIKIVTADVNFDAIPEILIQGPSATRMYELRGNTLIYSNNTGNILESNQPTYNPGYLNLPASSPLTFYGFSNATTAGNFFNDSIQVTYQQVNYLSNGKPTILAVIAAAPTKSGISQNYANTQTSFGQSTSQSTSNETSTGYSVGAKVTFGFEHDINVLGEKVASFGASISASIDYATTQSQKTTKTIQYANTWTTGADHNGVVYSTTEYKNWNYTILDSSNPVFDGKTMTYSYPYYVGIFKKDANVFDASNPGYNITTGTFGNQTIGNPTTYPSLAQAKALTSSSPIDFIAPTYRPVNQGSSTDTQEIDVSTELSTSTSVDYTVGASLTTSASVGDVSFEAEISGSHSWGSTAEVSIGKGTSYSAAIGQISNNNDWNQWSYGWGMFVYLLHRSDLNISYQVVNFYTGNFGTGYVGAYYKLSSPITNHTVAMNVIPAGYQITPPAPKEFKPKN